MLSRSSRRARSPAAAAAQWWKSFADPLLDELLERVSRDNLDVRKAGARLAEAGAVRGGARAALLPSIDTAASTAQFRGGYNQGVVRLLNGPGTPGGNLLTPFESTLLLTGFNMRWEADILGGLRKSLRAAGADQMAASEEIRNVQVLARAEIARNYIEMRAAEEQTKIVEANVAAEQDLLDLVRARADAGLASDSSSGRWRSSRQCAPRCRTWTGSG